MWRDQVKLRYSSTSAEIPKTGQNKRIKRGEQWDLFLFAPRFDAVELRSSPRVLATAQNTNCQVRLRELWAMADALCAESWCTVCSTSVRKSCAWRADMPPHCCRGTRPAALALQKLNCGLSHENEPPSIPLFNLVAPHIYFCGCT
jgi:hypothetical protein